MKKRFIALLLCCVMLLTLSPSLISAASATDNGTTQSTEEQETPGENTNPTGSETPADPQPDATSGNNPPADPQPDANNGNTSAEVEKGGSGEEKSKTDFASMTVEELYAYVKKLSTDAEIEAFLMQLPEQSLKDLNTYAQAQEPTVVPKTVVFTDAGPFMPPVNVAMKKKLLLKKSNTTSEELEEPADNGLELSKEATANNDGSYTIRMEAYTTGTVTTSTKTVPVDIVLVLDQSGSMAYDFSGNSTNTNTDRRQYAMKQAVNNFIEEVAKKYATEADHRMAIVTFGSNASTLQGWTYVNDDGKTTLQGKINNLPDEPSGGTQTGAGMEQAETLMVTNYSYSGSNTERQKVVILFTDGVPGDSGFDIDVANSAIASSKRIKASGATVYSVGIFSGASPNELYGSDSELFNPPSDGSIESYWLSKNSRTLISGIFGGVYPEDVPAGNRFLNYLSSNYASAESIGLSNYSLFDKVEWEIFYYYRYGYKIETNFEETGTGYFLTANDSTSLNNIFKTISDNIQAANIDLGSETVIKDTVSPYFDAPAKTSDINLYTAAANADGTFEDDVSASGVTAAIENGVVSVTGFNFNANFVSDTVKSDGTYGKKLIIEFTVTPKDGFLGGNDVPTNGADSGVYKDGSAVESFPVPTVNVPIKDVTVTATDKNVYLLHTMTDEECKTGAEATCNGVNLLNAAEYTGVNAWKAEFVTITTNITKPTEAMTADGTYTITVNVSPTNNVTGGVDAKTGANSPAANINVFKPELTFKDSEVYYGETAPDCTGNLTDTKWKHGDTASTTVTMIGTAPTLSLTYTPDSTKIENNKINTKQDIAVDVAVKIGEVPVTEYATFMHQACNPACGWSETALDGSPAFLLHVNTCTLIITKTGGTNGEPYVFTVKKNGEKYTEVTIVGNSSVTIYELPVGTYTIAEDTGWSWRFKPSYSTGVTLSKDNTGGTITCTNSSNGKIYWLNGFSKVLQNIYEESSEKVLGN